MEGSAFDFGPGDPSLTWNLCITLTICSGFTVDNLMKFCVHTLQHHSGQVRLATENLIIKLYKEHGKTVKYHTPYTAHFERAPL